MNESLIEDIYPLSPMQEGLLFQSLYDPDPEAYFVQMNFRFRGELQTAPFQAPIPQLQRKASIVEMGEAEAQRLLLEKI